MTRPSYILRKPANPEVQPYVVDRIEPHPHDECSVYVTFEGFSNFTQEEYKAKVEGLHVAKGFFHFKGHYYAPDEFDRLYVRVDEECPTQEDSECN